jgi:asparagine synthase (glutamine-hydrolysing)
MRTNGFAVFSGPEREQQAQRAGKRVERYCKEIVTFSEDGRQVVGYCIDGDRGLPIVHGFIDAKTAQRSVQTGEFALVVRDGEKGLVASRDKLGTRPLYTNEDGSCVASDHRFFTSQPTLLPSGAHLELSSMNVTVSKISGPERSGSAEDLALELSRILTDSVTRRVEGRKKVAVSFSGGLDSSILALIASKETEVVLCGAYTKGSRDETHAKTAADLLGLEFVGIEVDRPAAESELLSLDLPFTPTPMDKALWCIYSTTAREATSRGASAILLGQLADELFGGYMKYSRPPVRGSDAAEMMLADVMGSGERAFIRDEEACARFSEVRFPFADEEVVSFALGVPVGHKIAGGERKVILRRAAAILGLPEAIVTAPKKAAQYSSGVAKFFD